MKLIVGLGNPGTEYAKTRHNVGYMLINYYANLKKAPAFKTKFRGEFTKIIVNDEEIYLLKPLTFMNLSGDSVKELANYFKISVADIIIISDDMDTAFSKARFRLAGGSGGHNGLKSIIACLGSEEFKRIRIGIGKPENSNQDVAYYVLTSFSINELKTLEELFQNLCIAIDLIIFKGFEAAMNRYNEKKNEKDIQLP